MDHYKTMPESPVDGNVLVYGPHGFNASADTFEDAVTFVCRLDDQHAEINKLRRMLHLADSMYEQAATQANDYAAENAALRAEVERLRADYAELHRAFWLLRRVTLPPHDISGTSMWGEALSIVNALPAPPEKEEE